MTSEEMDRKIAQHLGDPKITDECEYCDGCGELGGESDAYHCPKCRGSGKGKPRYVGPRYSTDLNAMHEAEQHLFARHHDARDIFSYRLCRIMDPVNGYRKQSAIDIIDATAEQHAKAFIETIQSINNS